MSRSKKYSVVLDGTGCTYVTNGRNGMCAIKITYFLCVVDACIFNEELNDLYSSPNIVRIVKSRRMR